MGWRAHREALQELALVTFISVSPLLLGAVIQWAQLKNEALPLSYWGALNTYLVRGELFLYALAFIASIAWVALREWPAGLRPPRVLLGGFCIGAFGLITGFYSLDTANVLLHPGPVLVGSKIVFCATLVFYYLATVLSKIEAPDYPHELAASSAALAAKLGGTPKP
ncbi:MAG TPA: hypothetical protein VGR79_03365 [Stellaceae bacterium]|nr:hypothetical protein [Stellaceae bacterium]